MKRTIRITESDLHNIVRRCINEVLEEGQGWDAVKSLWNRRGEWMDDPDTYSDEAGFNKELKNWVNTGDTEGDKAISYKESDPFVGHSSIEPGDIGNGITLKKANQSLRGRIGRSAAGAAIKGMHKYGKAKNAIKNGFNGVRSTAWQS